VVPSVVVPFVGDQFFWGQRVAELGVGPAPIPRKKLTVEALAQAIQEAISNETMRHRATKLGARIRAEDGTARAVAVVQDLAEGGVP
jgi:UDP:flavonoid glycosyltransferase YjiC (YdhE family)